MGALCRGGGGIGMCTGGIGRETGRDGDRNYIQNIIARNLIFRSKCDKTFCDRAMPDPVVGNLSVS